jgi:hypothetical protein
MILAPFGSQLILFCLWRRLGRRASHFIKDTPEFFESGRGDDNGIAPAIDILRNSQKPTAGIFLQCKEKSFPLNLEFVTSESVFDDCRFVARVPRRVTAMTVVTVRPVAVRRWTFVRYHTPVSHWRVLRHAPPLRTLTKRGLSTDCFPRGHSAAPPNPLRCAGPNPTTFAS